MKNELEKALEIIEDYLNAGDKESRKQASIKAKLFCEKVTGKPYKNKNEKTL